MKFLLALIAFTSCLFSLRAEDASYPNIQEKLGSVVPLDKLKFCDENGVEKTLKELSNGKPIALALAFYKCRSICMPFLNGVGSYVERNKTKFQPGRDFELLTISIDPNEKSDLAKDKKHNQFAAMLNQKPQESWRFLTGDAENIHLLTDIVGFKYVEKVDEFGEKSFLHKSALIILSPEGKIVRYIAGDWREGKDTYFNDFTVELAIADSFRGIPGPSYAKFLNVCFKYEPQGRKYSLKVLQISGVLITLSALGLFLSVTILSRKPKVENDPLQKEGSSK